MRSGRDVVLPTGTANLASVLAAFRRIGLTLEIDNSPGAVSSARRLVLPGVGAFGAAMSELRRLRLVDPIEERIRAGQPTLAICVGMQILAGHSEESPGTRGIGVIEEDVARYERDLIVPQLAWSQVIPGPESNLVEPGWGYFANSYRLGTVPQGWAGSTATYGKPFVAAIEKGDVLACQFHPELSGEWGSDLLQRWAALS